MKKLHIWLVVVVVAVASASAIALTEQAAGSSRLHQINQSGIKARILFLDTGSSGNGLVVSGSATGLTPGHTYISLIYDKGSVPGGPNACEPSSAALSFAQMFVGAWQVAPDGTGTLFAIKAGPSYAPLSDFDAVSVRDVVGPGPAGAVLQACGQVHGNP